MYICSYRLPIIPVSLLLVWADCRDHQQELLAVHPPLISSLSQCVRWVLSERWHTSNKGHSGTYVCVYDEGLLKALATVLHTVHWHPRPVTGCSWNVQYTLFMHFLPPHPPPPPSIHLLFPFLPSFPTHLFLLPSHSLPLPSPPSPSIATGFTSGWYACAHFLQPLCSGPGRSG